MATGIIYELSELQVLAPAYPSKIVGVGLNYIDHAENLESRSRNGLLYFSNLPRV